MLSHNYLYIFRFTIPSRIWKLRPSPQAGEKNHHSKDSRVSARETDYMDSFHMIAWGFFVCLGFFEGETGARTLLPATAIFLDR